MGLVLEQGSLDELMQLVDDGCTRPRSLDDLHSNSEIIVAYDSGQKMGYGSITHSLHGQPLGPKLVFIDIGVLPQARRREVGSALFRAVLTRVQRLGVEQVSAVVAVGDEGSLNFAEVMGFRVDYRICECSLDLHRFDGAPWEPMIASLQSKGIYFTTLADVAEPDSLVKAIYELDRELSADIPQWAGFMPPFQSYASELLAAPEGVHLALAGDELVGISIIVIEPESVAYGSFMGVKRSHRGLGIALALKLHSIAWAKRSGLSRLVSHNNVLSLPILELNRKLGYEIHSDAAYLIRAV